MELDFEYAGGEVYVINDFMSKKECDVIITAFKSMDGKERHVSTKKKGERYDNSCFYKNFVHALSPYKNHLKKMRARAIRLIRYLYGYAEMEATLVQKLEDKGMEYHCDALKRDQEEPYISKSLHSKARKHGYGIHPPPMGGKDLWQPHHGSWTWGHALYRAHTGLIYLSEDFEGGETRLPYLDLDVAPKVGRILLFKGIPEHEHGVRPVSKGTRYTFVNWTTVSPNKSENFKHNITPYDSSPWV